MKISIKSYSSNVLSQVVVQIITALKALIILPIISKNLGEYYYGLWSQIVITITLLSSVLTLRFDIVLVRYFSKIKKKEEFRIIFNSMFLLIFLVLILISLLLILFSSNISYLLFRDYKLNKYVLILTGLLFLRTIFLFILSYYRAQYKIKFYSLIQSIQIIGEITILYFTIIYLNLPLIVALIALFLYNLSIELFLFILVLKDVGITLPDLNYIKPFLLFSLPLIPNVSLQWVINFSDRYLIAHFLDLENVGIYSGSYTIGHVITFFVSPLAFVLYPTISKLWEEKNVKELKFWVIKTLKIFLFLAIPSIFGIYYFSPLIIHKLATTKFLEHQYLIVLIAGGYLFVGIYQIYLYLIHLKEKTIWILYLFLFIAFLNILLNIILIPKIGIEGAAISTLISYFLQAFFTYIISKRYFHILLPIKFISKVILSSFVMYLFLISWDTNNWSFQILKIILAVFIYLVVMVTIKGININDLVKFRKVF